MNKRYLFKNMVITGLLATGILTTACTKPQPPAPGPPQVSCWTVQQEEVVLTTELPGRTSAYLIAEIRPQVNGIIQKRLFTEGADVKSGSILYQINPEPYQAAYDQAAAAVQVAEAALPSLKSRVDRLEALLPVRAVGEQDVEDARAALLTAEANAAASHAALESARINLSYTPIKAPISGRIGHSIVTIGGMVTAYQPMPLTTIQQLDPIYVDVPQATTDLLRLKNAQTNGDLSLDEASRQVTLLLEDGTPYPHKGTLQFRDVTVDPTTGSVRVRMIFPNPDYLLLPGMYVRAVVEEGHMESAILAPQQGITRDPKGNAIAYLVNKENTVEVRPISLDRAIGDKWLVTDGLQPGDRLIMEGRLSVFPGTPVTVTDFTSTGEAPVDSPPVSDPAAPDAE